jgi:hypothetical protein
VTDAPAILLLPGLLTFIVYAVALFVVIATRRLTSPPPRSFRPMRRERPRLRVVSGGASRARRA